MVEKCPVELFKFPWNLYEFIKENVNTEIQKKGFHRIDRF